MEYAIADYNGTAHGSLGGRTPLEFMQAFVRDKGQLPRVLPEPQRRNLRLLQHTQTCTVRAYMKSGRRPHINLFGITHTNIQLARSAALVGQKLQVFYDPSDLRSVQAFLPDHTEFGPLIAQGHWGTTRHTLALRQEILRLKRARQLRYLETANPFSAYLDYHRDRAAKSKKHAAAMASLHKLQKERPTALPLSIIEPAPDTVLAFDRQANDAADMNNRHLAQLNATTKLEVANKAPRSKVSGKRVVAHRLSIGTGHSFRKPP